MRWIGWTVVLGLAACDGEGSNSGSPGESIVVDATIANIATPGSVTTSAGDMLDVMLSPGVWAVHIADAPLLIAGEQAGPGLESLAEDGNSAVLLDALPQRAGVLSLGSFGATRPGENYAENPLAPGDEVGFQFEATTTQRLSFASMYIHSNDVVAGAAAGGLALDELVVGEPRDFSMVTQLWDAGTERNEEPGVGPSQPMRQAAPGDGDVEGGTVQPLTGRDDAGFDYPAPAGFLRVTLLRIQ